MHKEFDITIKNLTRIEGHTDLDIKVRGGKVEDVKLKISENKRFYTQAVRGKPFQNVPQLVSRICGTCNTAHLTCCSEAIENALAIEPSEQTILMRKLAMYGTYLRDHAMHLYLFSLPDIFGRDSVLDFDESQKEWIHQAFHVKGAGYRLTKLITGRAIHAIYSKVGGFTKIPEEKGIKRCIEELKENRAAVLDLIQVFYNCDFEFLDEIYYVALRNKDFSYRGEYIESSSRLMIPKEHYWDHLHRVVIPYSEATAFEFEGKEYLVGALARMNLNRNSLNRETKKDVKKYLRMFPSNNIFHNNLAQAIEMLHCIDHSIELLESAEFKEEKIPEAIQKDGSGIGVIEAPRGTLYYKIVIGNDGKIKEGNLVIPTAQNQINMQDDVKKLVQNNLDKDREWIHHEIEKLIRAYDPCMSCATHFLRVNWI